jgi:hypothetical protein
MIIIYGKRQRKKVGIAIAYYRVRKALKLQSREADPRKARS